MSMLKAWRFHTLRSSIYNEFRSHSLTQNFFRCATAHYLIVLKWKQPAYAVSLYYFRGTNEFKY